MRADPSAQQTLLTLQEIDTALAQLAHARRTLPEHAQLEQLTRDLTTLAAAQQRAQEDVGSLDREIAKMEREVEQVRARQDRDATRLAAGTGPARELTALQSELESLRRRQTELEDVELELMERREQEQAALAAATAEFAAARDRQAEAEARRDTALADIAAQEAARTSARAPVVAQLPAELVSLYERIRDDSGGVGAALLRGGRCGGCRLDISGSERARIKAADPDEVLRCDECRRIMVRTAESGL